MGTENEKKDGLDPFDKTVIINGTYVCIFRIGGKALPYWSGNLHPPF